MYESKLSDICYTFDIDYLKVSYFNIYSMSGCKDNEAYKQTTLALNDALHALGGKWKICIVQSLSFGPLRFKDLQDMVAGISPKVLSKELQDLEENLLLVRTVNNTKPVTVSYSLTEHANEIQPVFEALVAFGAKHRKKIKNK